MRFFAVLLCLCTLALAGCTDSAPKSGVVDTAKIVQDSNAGRLAVDHAQKIQEILQTNLNTVQVALEKYPNKQQVQVILQRELAILQDKLAKEQAKVSEVLNAALRKTIADYRASKNLDMIFAKDSVMEYSTKADVTPEVLALFQKVQLELPPLPLLVSKPGLPAPLPVAAQEKPAASRVQAAPAPAQEQAKPVRRKKNAN